ncbi:transposase zinc-binding domain-containing protein [Sorangium sp. So ce1128]
MLTQAESRPLPARSMASRPAPHAYAPREPHQTVLYGRVQEHLATFVAHAGRTYAAPLPKYVVAAFEGYLAWGDLARGFVRCHCDGCGHDVLVAFSCKHRGPCPSCASRRMCNEAATLVDRILPNVPVRQWVMSLPFDLRALAAKNSDVLAEMERIFAEEIARVRILDHLNLPSHPRAAAPARDPAWEPKAQASRERLGCRASSWRKTDNVTTGLTGFSWQSWATIVCTRPPGIASNVSTRPSNAGPRSPLRRFSTKLATSSRSGWPSRNTTTSRVPSYSLSNAARRSGRPRHHASRRTCWGMAPYVASDSLGGERLLSHLYHDSLARTHTDHKICGIL